MSDENKWYADLWIIKLLSPTLKEVKRLWNAIEDIQKTLEILINEKEKDQVNYDQQQPLKTLDNNNDKTIKEPNCSKSKKTTGGLITHFFKPIKNKDPYYKLAKHEFELKLSNLQRENRDLNSQLNDLKKQNAELKMKLEKNSKRPMRHTGWTNVIFCICQTV